MNMVREEWRCERPRPLGRARRPSLSTIPTETVSLVSVEVTIGTFDLTHSSILTSGNVASRQPKCTILTELAVHIVSLSSPRSMLDV